MQNKNKNCTKDRTVIYLDSRLFSTFKAKRVEQSQVPCPYNSQIS